MLLNVVSCQYRRLLIGRQDRALFVLVLIDGDITLFRDSYVNGGSEGGQLAAIDLCATIKDTLAKEHRYESHWELKVRTYVNMDGLAKAYRTSGVVPDEVTFRAFIKTFNKEHILFDFTDASEDKKTADQKVQKDFDLFWGGPQCKHIILEVSGHDGYAASLREHAQTGEHRQRIILLKTLPYPKGPCDYGRTTVEHRGYTLLS